MNIEVLHTMEREIDVQKLCEGVLFAPTHFFDNPNGFYESSCPFCHATEYRCGGKEMRASISEIIHSNDCVYLIAKDLRIQNFTKNNRL